MGSRYKKIVFKELDGGKGQIYYDKDNPNRFKTSLGLVPDRDSRRLKLAEDFDSYSLASAKPHDAYIPTSCLLPVGGTEVIYHLIFNTVDDLVKLYFQNGYGALQHKLNFSATSDEAHMLVHYEGLLLAWFSDGGANKQDWSSDSGATFTHQAWAYLDPKGYIVAEDGSIYVFTQSEILRSVDGKTWTLLYDCTAENKRISGIEELDGEFYALITVYGSSTINFVKFDSDDLPVIIRSLNGSYITATLKKFDNRIILTDYSNGRITFLEWDKARIKEIGFIEYSTSYVKFLYADEEYLIFSYNRDALGKINVKNGIFIIETLNPSANVDRINTVFKYNGNLCVTITDYTTPTFYVLMHRNDAGETRQATGVYYTPVIDEGRHVPAHLMIKHKSLGADASVVVKAKVDQGATFAVTCINNTTDDSVYKEANLKSLLNECDFIEFEVTLADSSNAGDIKDIELIYLYQPAGLESAE